MRTKGYLLPEETTGHPLRCVSLLIPDALEYRAALVRQLYDLGQHYVWDGADEEQAESAAQVWRDTLQSSLTMFDDAPCPTDETGCNQFSPGAPFIEWFPNDPYNTPDLVPEGYSSPPWFLATTASNLAYGSSTLDVITTLDRLPPGSLPDVLPASGLPRFRINVTGEGEINIHLVNLFAGSIIQLTLDDDPLTVKFIDVSKDVISVPPETLQEFIVPVQFDTPGDHHVDCIVVAWVNDTFPFLFFGAGLRQVDLCGFAAMPTVPPTMIRSDPSGCGNLEKSTDGGTTWTDVPDTDFLRRDGTCAMTGGLEIYPTANQVLLTMKGAVNPYQAAKIMIVQDGAGVDVAWINPRGDMTLSGQSDGLRALILQNGGILFDHNKYMYWKDSVATIRLAFGVGSNQMFFRAGTAGLRLDDSGGNTQFTLDASNVLRIQNNAGASATQLRVRSGASQGATVPLQLERNNGDNTVTWNDSGQQISRIRNLSNSIVVDGLQLDNRPTTGGVEGSGVALRMTGSNATGSARNMALLYAAWEEPTEATRRSKVVLSAYDFSGEHKIIEGGVTGASTPKVGFLGITPQPRLAITGDHKQNEMTQQIVEALALFGLVTDATTNVEYFPIIGDTGGWELFGTMANALETYSPYFTNLTDAGECLIVCEEAPPEFWCKEYDFTTELGRTGWSIERGVASGDGIESTMVDEVVFIHRGESQNFRITDVTIEYSLSGSGDGTCLIGNYDFTDTVHYDFGTIEAGVGIQILADLTPFIDFVGFRIVIISNDPAQEMSLTGLKVNGYDLGLYDVMGNGEVCP